jgi:MoaA/NifB/PqqE/SkfB family radical SAM enzyme
MKYKCDIPWSWLEINLDNKQIRSCCKTSWIHDQENKLFQHNQLIERRNDFLTNQQPLDCEYCWTLEKENKKSYRFITSGNPYLQTNDYSLDIKFPKTLSLNLGNLCNISCSYCNEEYSSVWASEKRIPIKFDKNLNFENSIFEFIGEGLINEKIQHIILIGGEPTINPNFFKLLEIIKNITTDRKTPLKVTIQTNGMFNDIQLEKIINYHNLKNVFFTYRFSIESIEERAEFIRTGLVWKVFIKNFEELMSVSNKHTNFKTAIHPTLNIYALEGLNDFFKWIDSYQNYNWETFGLNFVDDQHIGLRSLGIHCNELVQPLQIYKNKSITTYALNAKKFIKSFYNVPTKEDLLNIQKLYEINSKRSKIDVDVAIPELKNLIETLIKTL